jgi:hypothetical protein
LRLLDVVRRHRVDGRYHRHRVDEAGRLVIRWRTTFDGTRTLVRTIATTATTAATTAIAFSRLATRLGLRRCRRSGSGRVHGICDQCGFAAGFARRLAAFAGFTRRTIRVAPAFALRLAVALLRRRTRAFGSLVLAVTTTLVSALFATLVVALATAAVAAIARLTGAAVTRFAAAACVGTAFAATFVAAFISSVPALAIAAVAVAPIAAAVTRTVVATRFAPCRCR